MTTLNENLFHLLIKLIKCNSKYIYNVTTYACLKQMLFFLTFYVMISNFHAAIIA